LEDSARRGRYIIGSERECASPFILKLTSFINFSYKPSGS
jgi:hypothetical protein